MAVYSYKAIDQRQQITQGAISADTPRQARDQLRGRGLVVREVTPHENSAPGRSFLWRRRGMSSRVAATVRELATLLSVGVPVVEAIETLARQHRGAYHSSLLLLKDRVAAGASLAEAMGDQSDVFDELTCRMVEVGENAGNLDVVLEQLAEFKEKSLALKDRITSALLYPGIIFATSIAVSIFLMTVVVPMLLSSLLEAGRELPWPTRVLKFTSDTLLSHGWLLVLGAIAVVMAVGAILRSEKGRRAWHRILARVPLVGTMWQRQSVSRLAMVVATLMRSGIEYLAAAEIAARTSGDLVMRDAITRSSEAVRGGQDIGQALADTGVFPPLAVHVFTVGQASGRLEDMLDRLAETYDRQVTSLSTRLASVLEPLLILVLAVFVGFILFATLLPILEAGNVL